MGSMTDERRKEMEEEMMRFEQEIAFPADENPPGEVIKPLPPPPIPPKLGKIEDDDDEVQKAKKDSAPAVGGTAAILAKEIISEAISKPPPPPGDPIGAPPPPPPQRPSVPPSISAPILNSGAPSSIAQGPRLSLVQGPLSGGAIQFIPHQLHRTPRHPPPPPPPPLHRPNIMQMRAPPAFHGPPHMPFHMQGPMFPPMHPLSMPPVGMPLPMHHGFCPPPPPGMGMRPIPMGPMNIPPQPFVLTSMSVPYQNTSKKEEISLKSPAKSVESEVASAPAVYAAPPMKSLSDKVTETSSTAVNGQTTTPTLVTSSISQQMEEPKSAKTAEESVSVATAPTSGISEPAATKKEKKKKKSVRMAGGQAWEDNSLMEWDPDDFRIFCGDLGNDVTDEVLIRAFSKYPSFVKAKVIRDKRTNKTKGYGFVSFKDPQDFIKAMREMNGRYVGSRPIKLRKSTWRDRNIEIVRKKQKEKEKLGLL